jgi:hypothetical protein
MRSAMCGGMPRRAMPVVAAHLKSCNRQFEDLVDLGRAILKTRRGGMPGIREQEVGFAFIPSEAIKALDDFDCQIGHMNVAAL